MEGYLMLNEFQQDIDLEFGEGKGKKEVPDSFEKPNINVNKPENFMLEEYIDNYFGEIKVQRLLYISQVCRDLRKKSLYLLLKHFREETYQIERFLEYRESYFKEFNENIFNDEETENWIKETKIIVQKEKNRISQSIKDSKANSITESIRLSYFEAAEFFEKVGNFNEAMSCFELSRDHCTTEKDAVGCFIRQLILHVCFSEFKQAEGIFFRLTSTKTHLIERNSTINCVRTLLYLKMGNYNRALHYLLLVDEKDEHEFRKVLSPNDLAMIGSLCILMTYNRTQLKAIVNKSSVFKPMLDYESQLKEVLYDFSITRYSKAFQQLNGLKNRFLLDIFIFNQVDHFYNEVFNNSIITFFIPFRTLPIAHLASQFNMSSDEMIPILFKMIEKRKLSARVDMINLVIHKSSLQKEQMVMIKLAQHHKRLLHGHKQAAAYFNLVGTTLN